MKTGASWRTIQAADNCPPFNVLECTFEPRQTWACQALQLMHLYPDISRNKCLFMPKDQWEFITTIPLSLQDFYTASAAWRLLLQKKPLCYTDPCWCQSQRLFDTSDTKTFQGSLFLLLQMSLKCVVKADSHALRPASAMNASVHPRL